MNRCTYCQTNEVLCCEKSWTYPQVLFEPLFYLVKNLNMVMVRNFEVILGQRFNHSV
jgi:hypothetical protein